MLMSVDSKYYHALHEQNSGTNNDDTGSQYGFTLP
jgi:hypothetical protein